MNAHLDGLRKKRVVRLDLLNRSHFDDDCAFFFPLYIFFSFNVRQKRIFTLCSRSRFSLPKEEKKIEKKEEEEREKEEREEENADDDGVITIAVTSTIHSGQKVGRQGERQVVKEVCERHEH